MTERSPEQAVARLDRRTPSARKPDSARHASTAERVARELRERIADARLHPGQRLSEEPLALELGVSRNTLREGFRLLGHEGLVHHVLNRGVFVQTLSEHDVRDLYRLRRMLECGALREFDRLIADETAEERARLLADVLQAVQQGETGARTGMWSDIPTADLDFHRCITALAQSRRADELMRQAIAELRLVFWVMAGSREFHEPYLRRNRAIFDLLIAGDVDAAEGELLSYLHDAETELIRAYGAIRRR